MLVHIITYIVSNPLNVYDNYLPGNSPGWWDFVFFLFVFFQYVYKKVEKNKSLKCVSLREQNKKEKKFVPNVNVICKFI